MFFIKIHNNRSQHFRIKYYVCRAGENLGFFFFGGGGGGRQNILLWINGKNMKTRFFWNKINLNATKQKKKDFLWPKKKVDHKTHSRFKVYIVVMLQNMNIPYACLVNYEHARQFSSIKWIIKKWKSHTDTEHLYCCHYLSCGIKHFYILNTIYKELYFPCLVY